jgi:glycosyltransferase involved in cell wall biosynthesis
MPAVSSNASESPVIDGQNGFVASDPVRLNGALRELLARRELALELGKRARETALSEFSVSRFVSGWHAAIEEARARYRAHLNLSPLSSRAGLA